MSFDAVVILDAEGERRIDIKRLPLRVGTGIECELRLPGPGGGPVALLELVRGCVAQLRSTVRSLFIDSNPASAHAAASVRAPFACLKRRP